MTDRERAIIMAYTGTVMLCGDKLKVFYDYVSEKFGRPVWTHEFFEQADAIKELSKEDFFSLCAGKPYKKPDLYESDLKGEEENETEGNS